VVNEQGWPHAGAELVIGDERKIFLLDLTQWGIAAYQRQWREGIGRLARGDSSSALLSAYRGPSEARHDMWALWREGGHVYVQGHTVLSTANDAPFDPSSPYAHVGVRIPATEQGLPIPEWRFDLSDLIAADLGIRWPG
jgi:hypothetical protein